MQSLRDLLRADLRHQLDALTPADRLAAAWPVVAGHAIAAHSSITAFERGVAVAQVEDSAWLLQLRTMGLELRADLARVSGLAVTDILFEPARPASGHRRTPRP